MTTKLSRAYLEESLTAAKRLLPGWQYATIRQAAIPRAGARARHSPEKRPPSAVQSLIFDKATFTADQARAWASEHGYESVGVDETDASFRFRQEEPGDFVVMRTIALTEGVKAVIGIKGAAEEGEAIGKGSPDQPRDEEGKWTGIGGASSSSTPGLGAYARSLGQRQRAEPLKDLKYLPDKEGGNVDWSKFNDMQALSSREHRASQYELGFPVGELHEFKGMPTFVVEPHPLRGGSRHRRSFDSRGTLVITKSEPAPIAKAGAAVPTSGPAGAPILFVGTATTALDFARREPLTGQAGATFREEVLAPLGLRPDEVAVTNLVPVPLAKEPDAGDAAMWRPWIEDEIRRVRPALVVALGKTARDALGDLADFGLPHPAALRGGDTRGEVARKVKALRKSLTEKLAACTSRGTSDGAPIQGAADATSSQADLGVDRAVRVAKADRAKQVVYGVVLDPYVVDTQNDWTPPAEIEQAAHRWLAESRVVGLSHEGKAKAVPVESYMVPYPSEEDYTRAMRGEPHRAARTKLGEQEVASGAWILGVRVDDADTWAKVDAGELDAFSIGGFSERANTTRAAMPSVEFV